MVRVDIEQGTPEWHAWRAEGIGGSDIATVMGRNQYETPYKFFCERKKLIGQKKETRAMAEGKKQECFARKLFELKHGVKLTPGCYQNDNYPFVRASLDGISWDEKTNVQIKVMQPHNFDTLLETQAPPEYMILQTQWEMLASPADRSILFIVNALNGEPWEETYIPCEKTQIEAIKAASDFMRRLRENDPPPLTDADLEWKRFFEEEEYVEICEQIATLEKRKTELKKGILDKAGPEDCRGTKITVKHSVRETVDWKSYVEQFAPGLPGLEKYTKYTPVTTIRTTKK